MKKIIIGIIAGVFLLLLTSCNPNQQDSGDIINPDADYVYFYGATCPHCQELNTLLEEENMYDKVAIEKREVYYNDVNREAFLEVTEKLKLESKDTGVPFVLEKSTGEFATGVQPAFQLLSKGLHSSSQKTEESPNLKDNNNSSQAVDNSQTTDSNTTTQNLTE